MAQQALWLTKYLDKVGLSTTIPVIIQTDNNESISNSINNKNHYYIKYINIKYHFVKQRTKCGQVIFNYILSVNNVADLFTKILL